MLFNLWMEFGQYLLNKQKTEKKENEERERKRGLKWEWLYCDHGHSPPISRLQLKSKINKTMTQ